MEEGNYNIEWNKEKESLNKKFASVFIYLSVFGIMIYTVFDYYAIPENWLLFLALRLMVSILAVLLLVLAKRKIIKYTLCFVAFLSAYYLFFAYGASAIKDPGQLFTWNLSITLAGVFWPYFIIIIDYKKTSVLSAFFIFSYFLFYFLNSSVGFYDLLINGGLIFLGAAITPPFIANSRYQMHKRSCAHKVKLQEEISIKNRFFSIISHDLKSPFNSLLGFSKLLVKNVEDKNYSKIEEYSNIIHDGLNQTYILTENLLEWSSAQVDGIPFNPEKFLIAKTAKQTIDNLEHIALQKRILVSSSIHSELEIYADKNMFLTLLRNLITNAIKYTRKGGLVEVAARNNTNETVISVSDNGVGIDPKDLVRLFKLEHSVSNPGTIEEEGSGLGLLICKELVEKHKGKIWVNSTLGEGSVFYFSFPNI